MESGDDDADDDAAEAWPVGVAVANHFLSEMTTRPRTKRTTMGMTTMGQLRGALRWRLRRSPATTTRMTTMGQLRGP